MFVPTPPCRDIFVTWVTPTLSFTPPVTLYLMFILTQHYRDIFATYVTTPGDELDMMQFTQVLAAAGAGPCTDWEQAFEGAGLH